MLYDTSQTNVILIENLKKKCKWYQREIFSKYVMIRWENSKLEITYWFDKVLTIYSVASATYHNFSSNVYYKNKNGNRCCILNYLIPLLLGTGHSSRKNWLQLTTIKYKFWCCVRERKKVFVLFSCCIATGFGIRYCSSSLFQIPRKRARMKIKALLIAATRRENREDLENAPQINPKMELVCKQCNRLKINMMKTIPPIVA